MSGNTSYALPKASFKTHPSIKASVLAEMSSEIRPAEDNTNVADPKLSSSRAGNISFNKKTRFQDSSDIPTIPHTPTAQPMTVITDDSHKNSSRSKTEGSNSLVDLSTLPIMPLVVRAVELMLGIIYFICAVAGPTTLESAAGWAIFVSIVGIIITLSLILIRMTKLQDHLPANVPWTAAELIFCFTWTVFYLISSVALAAACGRYRKFNTPYNHASAWAAGAFFGFLATLVYGFDTFLRLLAWQQEEKERAESHPSPPHPNPPTIVPTPLDPGKFRDQYAA